MPEGRCMSKALIDYLCWSSSIWTQFFSGQQFLICQKFFDNFNRFFVHLSNKIKENSIWIVITFVVVTRDIFQERDALVDVPRIWVQSVCVRLLWKQDFIKFRTIKNEFFINFVRLQIYRQSSIFLLLTKSFF